MSDAGTMIVEERLARIEALLLALESVAARGGDFPGDPADTCGWLRTMAHDELRSLKAALDNTVLNTST